MIFLAVSLIAVLPFLGQNGVIGHSLDWSIPENATNFAQKLEQSKYLWNDTYNEGFDMANGQVEAWSHFLIGTMGTSLAISGATVSKLVAFLATFAPAFFMYLLAYYFLEKFLPSDKKKFPLEAAAIIAGLIYGYSPIIFNQIIGGPITYYISYALLPLVILFAAKSVSETGRWRWACIIAGGITYGGAFIANQFAVFIAALFFLYIFFAPRFRKRYFWAFMIIAGQAVLLNLYWLLPIVNNLFSTIKSLYTLKGAPTALSGLITHGIPFAEAINLTGFWNPYFIEALPPVANAIWLVSTGIIIILAVSTIVFQKRNSLIMFSIVALLISLFFVKGGLPPFGAVNMAIYTYFTPFFLFRTLHHILVLPTFSLAILFSFWSAKKLSRLKQTPTNPSGYQVGRFHVRIVSWYNSKLFFPLLISILAVVYISPFLFGLLDKDLKTFVSSQELQTTVREIEQDDSDVRLVYFPMSNSPKFLRPDQGDILQGNDPNMAFSPTPLVTVDTGVDNDGKRFSRDAALALYNDYPTALPFFSLLNSKYFVFLKDRKPAHYERELAFFGKENYKELLQAGLQKRLGAPLRDSNVLSYWKYDGTLPLIYPSNQVVEINDQPSSLLNLLNLDQLKNISNPTFLFSGDVSGEALPSAAKIDSVYINSFDSNYIAQAENWELGAIYAKSNKINNSLEYEFDVPADGDYVFDLAYSCEDKTIDLEIKLDDEPTEILNCRADSFDQFNLKSFGKSPLAATTHHLKIKEINKTKIAGSFHLYYLNFYRSADVALDKNLAELPRVSFEKINPTHYRAMVSLATGPFYLNFLESYHPGWQAMIDGQLLNDHQVVNGYANGWLIDKKGDYTIDITYKPQELYARACLSSLITLGILGVVLLVFLIREKYGLARSS